jgi:serine/threonine protein phosphatase 1
LIENFTKPTGRALSVVREPCSLVVVLVVPSGMPTIANSPEKNERSSFLDSTKHLRRAAMKDKFIFTDVHGCGKELEVLLRDNTDCDIISLGDNFDRAFDGVRVWELLMEYEVTCILGNHELKMLQFLKDEKPWLPKHYYQFLNEFSKKYSIKDLIGFIEKMPMLITENIGGRDFIFTHGGINLEDPRTPNLSCNVYGNFDPKVAAPVIADRDDDWWNFYDGDDLVLYGHVSHPTPMVKKNTRGLINSIGFDTAACHGNYLTGIRIRSGSMVLQNVKSEDYFSRMKSTIVEAFQT